MDVVLVGLRVGTFYGDKRGTRSLTADLSAAAARMDDFDALIVPGGYAPDRMRLEPAMIDLVARAMALGKPVAAICHGPQLLISADVLRDRHLTCWPSVAVDVTNAGGRYVDRPVVRDGNLITSRKGADILAFIRAIVDALGGVSGSGIAA